MIPHRFNKVSIPLLLGKVFFYSLILLLPTQLGLHFWPDFSYVLGIRVDYLSPTIYLTDALVFLLFSLWLFRKAPEKLQNKSKIKNQTSKVKFKRQNYFLFFICVFAFLFLIFNILIPHRILGGLYSLLKLSEMAFVAHYTAKFIDLKKVLPKVITLLSIGVIAESVIAIFQYLRQGSIGGVLYFLGERSFNASTPGIANASLNGELVLRPYATFPHPNVLAGYLVVVMILVLFSLQIFKKVLSSKYYVLSIAALTLGTVALFLTMSRVAILLWIIIGVYWLFGKIKKRVSALIFIAVVGVISFSPLGSRFTNINVSDEAIVQRSILIDASVKMIQSSPILGIGLGNFIPTLAAIQKPLSLGLYLQPVHNIFLLVAAETGLIGLGFFMWFLWKTYKMANGKWQMANGLQICFFAILALGLFDHYWLTLQQGQLLFALIIGLSWARVNEELL